MYPHNDWKSGEEIRGLLGGSDLLASLSDQFIP